MEKRYTLKAYLILCVKFISVVKNSRPHLFNEPEKLFFCRKAFDSFDEDIA